MLIANVVSAQGSALVKNSHEKEFESSKAESEQRIPTHTAVVNNLDTMVFDLAQADIAGNYIMFPISIITDDTVQSLDFAFKYNHSNLVLDSIINLTTYIQPYSFFNTTDSTFRYISNTLTQDYEHNVPLVLVRFLMLSGEMNSSDIYEIRGYLNGDPCTIQLTDLLITDVGADAAKEDGFKVYPNPASEKLIVEVPEDVSLELFNPLEERIFIQTKISAHEKHEIHLNNFAKGIYLVRISNDHFVSTREIIIQ